MIKRRDGGNVKYVAKIDKKSCDNPGTLKKTSRSLNRQNRK